MSCCDAPFAALVVIADVEFCPVATPRRQPYQTCPCLRPATTDSQQLPVATLKPTYFTSK
eukprot:5250036-Heterocapsa_arctica.AAC.1